MTDKPLLQFPCKFPIKAMGLASDNYIQMIFDIVKPHVPELKQSDITTRPSKDGKYLAATIMVEATSQEQLDEIYQALNQCKDIVMCL